MSRLLCNLLCLSMKSSDTESIKSKHFYKLISLLNFDDTSDITKGFVMTVTLPNLIVGGGGGLLSRGGWYFTTNL